MTDYFEFHQSTKHARGKSQGAASALPKGGQFDDSHKRYPRMQQIKLPKLYSDQSEFTEILSERSSYKSTEKKAITLEKYSYVIGHSMAQRKQIEGSLHKGRNYPSAGARYPVELYSLVVKPLNDLHPGVYHYSPSTHALERLWDLPDNYEADLLHVMEDQHQEIAVVSVMTARFFNTVSKYQNRGYRHILIEAGHIGQNIALLSTQQNINALPYGGINDTYIESLLDIDGTTESIVYAIIH